MKDNDDNMQLLVAMEMYAQGIICSFILKFSMHSFHFFSFFDINIKISALYIMIKKNSMTPFSSAFKIAYQGFYNFCIQRVALILISGRPKWLAFDVLKVRETVGIP